MRKYIQRKNRDKFRRAEELFCIEGLSIVEISQELKIAENQLYKWKASWGWDHKRKLNKDVFGSHLINLQEALENASEDIKHIRISDDDFSKKTDGISKLLSQIIKLRNQYETDFMASTVKVMSRFAVYVRTMQMNETQLEILENAMDGFFDYVKERYAKTS